MKKITLSIISLFLSNLIMAASANSGDFALRESSHCNRYFDIFEKKYEIPDNLLKAVSVTESGRWHRGENKALPWPWTINVAGKGYYYSSKKEAIKAVEDFKRKGRTSIDVGCMQINLKYHPEAFANLNQAFEPKYNIEYAAKFLANNYERTDGGWKEAVGDYHNKKSSLGRKYANRVYRNWRIEDGVIKVARVKNKSVSSKKVTAVVKPLRRSKPSTFTLDLDLGVPDASYELSDALALY